MSTVVVDPRPDQFSEQAGPAQLVVASAFVRAWETIGNSYEQLTVSPAPGNGARTVPAAHDHQAAAGFGAFLAQPPMRWQGIGGVGSDIAPATGNPFALTSTFGQGINMPRPADITLEIDGFITFYEFGPTQDLEYWTITADLGLLNAGNHTLALRVVNLHFDGWTVQGAEVWANNGEQMRLTP
jgi:hypothetical protein